MILRMMLTCCLDKCRRTLERLLTSKYVYTRESVPMALREHRFCRFQIGRAGPSSTGMASRKSHTYSGILYQHHIFGPLLT